MEKRFDFLVIGSGIAGLSYALKVAEHGTVAVVSKGKLEDTNTAYAQGGIAAVISPQDNFEKHIQDTLISGDGLCDEKVVKMVIAEGPAQIKELIKWGTDFDRKPDGSLDLAKEGGHSEQRVLHHKDNTGFEIERVLCEKARQHKNIEVFENYFAVDLITQHHLGMLVKSHYPDIECYGAYVLDIKTHQTLKFLAKIVMIATGGAGNIYFSTTNPSVATGDGIAMAYRAKCVVEDMEFMQFHPTSLYNPGVRPSFLITEAMRGFGAVLRTQDGEEFMHKYDKRGSLATRDITARAIDNEMKIRGDEYVYLDCRNLDQKALYDHFPNIFEKCKSIGIDLHKDMIPVVPAAHFLCGGIKVDMNGQSWINRLYAAGEVSYTGLHGANRLASNSLLEGIVYAELAARHSISNFKNYTIPQGIPEWKDEGTRHTEEMVLITQNMKEMQSIMSYYVGIVRSDLRLKRAMDRLSIIFDETEELYKKTKLSKQLCELRNLTTVCYLIIKGAQQRRESVGLHYNIDCPHRK